MSEHEYKPNTAKYREEQMKPAGEDTKKVSKAIQGTVKVKKKSELAKFADVFISEDVRNVKSYIFGDVLVPAIKKAIVDIVSDGVNMIFYGGTRRSDRAGSKVSYRSYYDRRDDDRRHGSEPRRPKTKYNYDEIILPTRGDAEEVITQLCDLIEEYKVATVADLYDLVGLEHDYTDNKYGWTNLRNATHERVRDGYVLNLPKAIPIN